MCSALSGELGVTHAVSGWGLLWAKLGPCLLVGTEVVNLDGMGEGLQQAVSKFSGWVR